MTRLYGRTRVVEFVRAALRHRPGADQPVPVVLLTGPRGSGGTALLDLIERTCGADCLKVRLDLSAAQGVDDAVLVVMRGLADRLPGIRPIRFARLALAVKALTYADDGGRAEFETYMRAARRYSGSEAVLEAWADRAAPLLASPEQQVLAHTAAKALGALLDRVGRHQEKAALAWFATAVQPGGGLGYEPLWRLYGLRHDASPAAARAVDRVLCAALLADLRADFLDIGLLRGRRVSNPLLLVDNAGGETGRRLLELITECRRADHRAGLPADPAVVVAARCGRLTGAPGRPVDPADGRLAFPPDRLVPAGSDHPLWWLPVRLAGLELDDVVEMCRSAVLGSGRHDADFLHALTGGHPGATADLVVLLDRLGRDPLEPHDLLETPLPPAAGLPPEWPEPDGEGTTVGDHLLRRFLPEFLSPGPGGPVVPADHPLLTAAAVCAATPGVPVGAGRAALQYLRRDDDDAAAEAHERLTTTLWLDDPDAGTPGLHPLAALLLRHVLARESRILWHDVHAGYLAHYTHTGDETLRHLHTLALVDAAGQPELGTVTAHLDRLADELPPAVWMALLDQVAAAPVRLRTTLNREAVVTRLAGARAAGDRRRVIARLTVARRLYGDRSFDPGHALAKIIADEYDHLAALTPGDSEPLYRASADYRRVQREWEN